MELAGVNIKYIRRNEKTGESTLLLRTVFGGIYCHGIMQHYPTLTPLRLTGTFLAEKSFSAETINFDYTQKEGVKKFLCSDYFSGLGEVRAEIVAEQIVSMPELILADLPNNESKAYSEAAIKAFRKINNFISFEKLMEYISGFGGRYYTAIGIYMKYRGMAIEHVKKDPYSLLMFDAAFTVCEKIAKENRIESCQYERIHAVVKNAMNKNHAKGNTRISFSNLCSMIHNEETRAKCNYVTNPLFVAEEILHDEYYIEYTDNEVYVYLLSDYQAEVQIANNVRRLCTQVVHYQHPELSISDLESMFSIQYSAAQKKSFDAISTSGIKVITGGPGTGKTTLLKGLLTKFMRNHPDKVVTLCAPTGCAAKRMIDATGISATTIHKLLQIRPYEKKELHRSQKISADCLVVDECSMIDSFLMAQLLSAVKSTALVILLGDKDQIPSVEAGDVFRDFIQSGAIEVYQLNTIFRQLSENAIVENSKNIIQGITKLTETRQFKIKRCNTEDDLAKEAVNIVKEDIIQGDANTKVYTPVKKAKYRCGTINMNRAIQSEKNAHNKADDEAQSSLEYGHYRYYIGDKVLFTKNNYEKNYYNGQEGVITCIQNHTDATYVTIATKEGGITISGSDINDIELSYAITAHKSQGGECDNAVIIIPKKPLSMLQRKILYVEITRARKNVIILSEQDALEQAISNFMEFPRITGLQEKISAQSSSVVTANSLP